MVVRMRGLEGILDMEVGAVRGRAWEIRTGARRLKLRFFAAAARTVGTGRGAPWVRARPAATNSQGSGFGKIKIYEPDPFRGEVE